jgi:O-antigen biosynthesis protein
MPEADSSAQRPADAGECSSQQQLERLLCRMRAALSDDGGAPVAVGKGADGNPSVSGLVALRQRAGRWLTSYCWGMRAWLVARRLLRRPVVASQPVASVQREAFRDLAEPALTGFLAGSQRLSFDRPNRPCVSVLLVLYNQAALTLQCLRSLQQQELPFELIVVDNASTDRTGELLGRLDGVEVIRNDHNAGFVEAVNQAAARANGEHLLLLNNDAVLLPGAMARAHALLAGDESIGSVGARVVQLDGRLQEAGSIIHADGTCEGYGRDGHPAASEFMFRREVDYCSGVFLMTPRAGFESLGGLDTRYSPAYYEDADYCVRLILSGYRNVYEPDVVVLHYEFASSGNFEAAARLQAEHRRIFARRHADFLSEQPGRDRTTRALARSRPGKPRLLYIDDRVPHASLGTGYPRCRQMVHELVALGFEVSFYPMWASNESRADIRATLPAEVEVALPGGRLDLQSFLLARHDVYSRIVVSRSHNMQFAGDTIARIRHRLRDFELVYDAEAVTASREMLALELAGKTLSPRRREAMLEAELALAGQADRVVAVSEHEAGLFREAGCARVSVIGHALGQEMTPADFGQRHGYLFVGALRDADSPNVDSLAWFVEDILPLLAAEQPDPVELTVVGDCSADIRQRLEREGVTFTGRLDELEPVFDQARVFIAPTRFAAGIPHKVHEAAAFGLPCVTTSLLARQLGWRDGRELLVADDARAFAGQCRALHEDEALWTTIRRHGRAAVERDCSPSAFRGAIASVFAP